MKSLFPSGIKRARNSNGRLYARRMRPSELEAHSRRKLTPDGGHLIRQFHFRNSRYNCDLLILEVRAKAGRKWGNIKERVTGVRVRTDEAAGESRLTWRFRSSAIRRRDNYRVVRENSCAQSSRLPAHLRSFSFSPVYERTNIPRTSRLSTPMNHRAFPANEVAAAVFPHHPPSSERRECRGEARESRDPDERSSRSRTAITLLGVKIIRASRAEGVDGTPSGPANGEFS